MSSPNPNLPNYFDPETYSTVRPGTDPGAYDRPHNEPRREEADSNLALPRWAIFLIVFVPIMVFCLAVAVYYLNRHRRTSMRRATSPIELRGLELQGQRYPSPTPSLPELYWSGVYPPDPSPASTQPSAFPQTQRDREPQRPRKRFNFLDKSLPDLPPHVGVGDEDEWETVPGTSRNNMDFDNAFEQHRRDRKAETKVNQQLFERAAATKKDHRNPRVNDSYSQYRQYNLQLSDGDTEIMVASDTDTMGPPTNTYSNTDRPDRAHRQRDANDAYVPNRNLVLDHVTIAPSSTGFPSQESEMSRYPETALSNDPWARDVARNRHERR